VGGAGTAGEGRDVGNDRWEMVCVCVMVISKEEEDEEGEQINKNERKTSDSNFLPPPDCAPRHHPPI